MRALGVTTATVSIDNPPFFVALEAALAETPIATTGRLPALASRAGRSRRRCRRRSSDESFEFYGRTLTGGKEQLPRWKRCIDAADARLGEALGQLYVEEEFPPAAKARCEAIVENLLPRWADPSGKLDWMSEPTRKRRSRKLATFGSKIGYPTSGATTRRSRSTADAFVVNRMAAAQFELKPRLRPDRQARRPDASGA